MAHAGHGVDMSSSMSTTDYPPLLTGFGYPANPNAPAWAAYVVGSCFGIYLPILMCSGRWYVVVLAFSVGLADVLFRQVPSWGIGLNFYAHAVLGVVMLKLGGRALTSEDGLHHIPPVVLFFSVPWLIFVSLLTIHRNKMVLHEQAHIWLYTLISIMVTSMASTSLVARWCPKFGGTLQAIRGIADPAALFGMGVLMISHLHDLKPLSIIWHKFQGYALLLQSVLQIWTINAHLTEGAEAHTSRQCRMLMALVWFFSAGTMFHMAVFNYLFVHGGFRTILYPGKQPDGFEEACSYVVADLLFALVWLVVLVVRLHRQGKYSLYDTCELGDVSPHCATNGADRGNGASQIGAGIDDL